MQLNPPIVVDMLCIVCPDDNPIFNIRKGRRIISKEMKQQFNIPEQLL